MKKDRFSLSRFVKSIITRGTPTRFELEVTNELSRNLSTGWKNRRGEAAGLFVPSSAFMTRDLRVDMNPALVGKRVQQLEGLL
ncbi:MAG TPA: hypothetical protein VHY59_10535, partial [Chthoniobacterales bacterium]|nr:hypothetical protein [Chthoniobacterales bacterium]